jgi:hypothetical protein
MLLMALSTALPPAINSARSQCGSVPQSASLGACRTWSVESENRPQRAQFSPDLQQPSYGAKSR